jgi:hypothetical protein
MAERPGKPDAALFAPLSLDLVMTGKGVDENVLRVD